VGGAWRIFTSARGSILFLRQVRDGVAFEQELAGQALESITGSRCGGQARRAVGHDAGAAVAEPAAGGAGAPERAGRPGGVQPRGHVRAEFESFTPYLYSSYESECEAEPSARKKVMILARPEPDGQGIEFDYCCCHASFALQEFGD